MNTFETWGGAITGALQNAWFKVAEFLPALIGAIIILLIGIVIASFLGKLTVKLLKLFKFDHLVAKTGANETLEKFGMKKGVTGIIGKAVKWFFIFVAFSAAIDILDISQLSTLVNEFILYLPNVLVAFLILILGLMGARVVQSAISRAVKASKIPDATGEVIATVAKWSVVVFSFMAALVQMKIAENLIQILFFGVIAMLALAGGLAFGLGSRDKVRQWIEKVQL